MTMKKVKDFLWGTFNYKNKGIPLYRWPVVGYHFMKLSNK